MNDKIICLLCGEETHSIQIHLKKNHEGVTLESYRETFPDAQILSAMAVRQINRAKSRKKEEFVKEGVTKRPLSEVFMLSAEALSGCGEPIMVTTFETDEFLELVPEIDYNYVFCPELLKTFLMGLEMNILDHHQISRMHLR